LRFSRSGIAAARRTGLQHRHFTQHREHRLDAPPDPLCDSLGGRILEFIDIVEIVVIELVKERCEGGFYVAVIDQPSGAGVHRPLTGKLDAKAVTMKPGALMPLRDIRQAMGSLKVEAAN